MRVCMYLLRIGANRDFTYNLKAHTISNKLVSKSAQKKGRGGGGKRVMTATNMCSNFRGLR